MYGQLNVKFKRKISMYVPCTSYILLYLSDKCTKYAYVNDYLFLIALLHVSFREFLIMFTKDTKSLQWKNYTSDCYKQLVD